jgi:hypothetical protein
MTTEGIFLAAEQRLQHDLNKLIMALPDCGGFVITEGFNEYDSLIKIIHFVEGHDRSYFLILSPEITDRPLSNGITILNFRAYVQVNVITGTRVNTFTVYDDDMLRLIQSLEDMLGVGIFV